ncbi:MAG TPA: hypothetical protein VFX16_30455 [Pseudonocardiaceae bacterium]|nr:hypothetical protein [Pseudonocardiaceae bacterium]
MIDDAGGRLARVDGRAAVSWLLKFHRLYAADPDLRSTRALAAALTAPGERPIAHTTVSRWEWARTRMPTTVLRRFEDVLGAPSGQLSKIVTHLWGSRPSASPAIDPELLDKCLGGEVVTATEWSDLAGDLGRARYALTSSGWQDLARRLVAEMSVSIGWRYLCRLSALRALQAHIEGGPAVFAAVEAFVEDPDCQVIVDPVALLADSTQRAARRFLLAKTFSPGSESELCGALIAWAARPPADELLCMRLASVAMSWLRDLAVSAGVREAATDLLASLPPSAWCSRVQRPPVRLRMRHAAFGEQPVVDQLLRTLVRAQTGRHAEDAIGPRVVQQALFSTDSDVRVTSVNVLHASPFRDVIADATADLLAASPDPDPTTTVALIDLLGGLGRQRHRQVMEMLLCNSSVAAAASLALAHLPGSTGSNTWRYTLAAHPHDHRRIELIGQAVLYANGMNGDRAGLELLLADPAATQDTIRRAQWWLRLPAAAVISARH